MTLFNSMFLAFITLLCFSTTTIAQLADNSIDINTAITDLQNNTYTIGQFQGTVNFNFPDEEEQQLNAIKNSDIFIQKTDALGNLIWVKQLITTSNSKVIKVDIDENNNLYLFGMFEQVIDLDPSTDTYILSCSKNPAFFIQQLDSEGKLLNAHQLNSSKLTGISYLIENVLEIAPVQETTNPTFSFGMDNY